MNECIVCLVHSPLCFFLWYRIFQIIQTQGKEKFFAFPLLSPDHPLFWGPTLAVALALQLLERQSHWSLILIPRGFLDRSEIFSFLWFFWNEHSRSYKLLPVHMFWKDPKLFSSFLDVVSCCIIESSAVAKLEAQCWLSVPRGGHLMLLFKPLKCRGPGNPLTIWERLKEGEGAMEPWEEAVGTEPEADACWHSEGNVYISLIAKPEHSSWKQLWFPLFWSVF